MTWLQRYRLRHYLRNSIWVGPVVTMVVAIFAVHTFHAIEQAMGWQANVNPETARGVLGALAGAMFTFIVFVWSCSLTLTTESIPERSGSPPPSTNRSSGGT